MFEKLYPSKVRDAAFLLQRSILNAKRNPLPEHLKLTDILQGKVEVPENLHHFSHYLKYGPNKTQAEDHHKYKKQPIKSIYEDIVFSASSGKKNHSNNSY